MKSWSSLLAVAIGACSPYAPDLGPEPFLCGTDEPKCPDGYTCVVRGSVSVCSNGGGAAIDARTDSGSGSGACTMPFSGVLATWSLTGQPGSQGSTPATTMAAGVIAGAVSRAAALTAASGVNSINASGWPLTAQLDPAKYYTISVTPPAGCAVAASSLALDITASGTGPTNAAVATSADSFAHTVTASAIAPSTPALTATSTAALEIRVYGFGASATGGTMRIQNTLTLSGALQ